MRVSPASGKKTFFPYGKPSLAFKDGNHCAAACRMGGYFLTLCKRKNSHADIIVLNKRFSYDPSLFHQSVEKIRAPFFLIHITSARSAAAVRAEKPAVYNTR